MKGNSILAPCDHNVLKGSKRSFVLQLVVLCLCVFGGEKFRSLAAKEEFEFTFAPPPAVRTVEELELVRKDFELLGAGETTDRPASRGLLITMRCKDGIFRIRIVNASDWIGDEKAPEHRGNTSQIQLNVGWRLNEQVVRKQYVSSIPDPFVTEIEELTYSLLVRTSYSGGFLAFAGGGVPQFFVSNGILRGFTCRPPTDTHVGRYLDLLLQLAFCVTGPKVSVMGARDNLRTLRLRFNELMREVKKLPNVVPLNPEPYINSRIWKKDERGLLMESYIDPWILLQQR